MTNLADIEAERARFEVTWRDVAGYEGRYQVSNTGLVRSLDSVIVERRTGKAKRHRGRILKFKVIKNYRMARLKTNGDERYVAVHRLVGEAFLGPLPAGLQTCHGDGDFINNNLSNLRYDTQSANQKDRLAHGTASLGEANPQSKLTNGLVAEIRLMHAAGIPKIEIARRLSRSRTCIRKVLSGETWSHLQ